MDSAEEFTLTAADACTLSIECWRLAQFVAQSARKDELVKLSYSVRRLEELLLELDINVVDFFGKIYDAGLPPEVVTVTLDESIPTGQMVVSETITPTIFFKGRVLQAGKIVVAQAPTPLDSA